jgi:hypothetical protein
MMKSENDNGGDDDGERCVGGCAYSRVCCIVALLDDACGVKISLYCIRWLDQFELRSCRK